MKHKIKSRLVGWGLLILIIIAGALCSCEPVYVTPQLKGTYETENLILNFQDSVVYAYTNNYKIEGQYYTFSDDSIRVKIGWKKSINNEFNISLLCRRFKYQIKGEELILRSNDFEIVLFNIK